MILILFLPEHTDLEIGARHKIKENYVVLLDRILISIVFRHCLLNVMNMMFYVLSAVCRHSILSITNNLVKYIRECCVND